MSEEAIIKKFNRGDTVQLKSGGPIMTVDSYVIWSDVLSAVYRREPEPPRETETVNCTWFDKNARKFGKFHQDLLKQVDS
jgi:uncharacterized protein YodC (DUF2158 family)